MELVRFIHIVGYTLGVAGVLFMLFPRLIMAMNAVANRFLADLDKGVLGHERLVGFAMLILSLIFLWAATVFKAQVFAG